MRLAALLAIAALLGACDTVEQVALSTWMASNNNIQLEDGAVLYQSRREKVILRAVVEDLEMPWDLVFLDPPFDSGLAIQALAHLQEGDCVAAGGFVYVEMAKQLPELHMQPPFELYREKVMGDVRMRLFRRGS